ncbi:MAG TPA: hypothetical protein VF993_06455, partial [Myxococcales bacterium]
EAFLSKAQTYLARAASVNQWDGQTLYYQAELKVRREQWPDAERDLKRLIERKWDRAHVRNLLGYVYDETNRPDLAQKEWQKAAQIDMPADANNWAIRKVNPPTPTQAKGDGRGDQVPEVPAKGFFRFNIKTQHLEPTAAPAGCWPINGPKREMICAR